MKKNKFELMAPVGSFSSLVAACKAKADAVYLGLNDFSMRFGKNNFKVSDLTKIKKICNLYPQKPKVYVTLNTIVYDSEIKKLDKLIKKIKDKVDAVICWDFAVINLCKKYKVPFFISTQASVANKETAKFYQKLGAKRIVLARELDLKQIKEISKIKGLEIEVFIHGAMCVSISGRCFMSQFLFNKSANRGECFHPCRRSYVIKDEKYGNELKLENSRVMSAKDLCALPFIEELKKIKIKSFKIEGRNRDSRYVDSVVKVYRKALDNDLSKNEVQKLMKELTSVYNRGFSSGFYLGKPTPKDFSEIENSASDTYKEFLGKIVHLYPKVKVGAVKLSNNLKNGEEIIVIGKKSGVGKIKITDMEIENKKVKFAKKGQTVGIKFPFQFFKNDEVYKIKKRK
ncbi:MAG: U32 family peptidase [Candidatus Pacebacteria bacterium]|nr:U32 family peptidase [Candidatus Paceibacterota bacterium]MDD3728946.1 U32 family peptidase [Candidatus Paceibacterota bacterium]